MKITLPVRLFRLEDGHAVQVDSASSVQVMLDRAPSLDHSGEYLTVNLNTGERRSIVVGERPVGVTRL